MPRIMRSSERRSSVAQSRRHKLCDDSEDDDPAPASSKKHSSAAKEPRSVSFSRRHMPGVLTSPPAHRTSASPSRSAIRRSSPRNSTAREDKQQQRRDSAHTNQGSWSTPPRVSQEAYTPEENRYATPLLPTFEEPDKLHSLICKRLLKVNEQIKVVAKNFKAAQPDGPDPLHQLLSARENAKTIRYIGYLALATKDGIDGWRQLLTNQEALEALVIGIIGNALQHHVFQAAWFGKEEESDQEFFKEKGEEMAENDAFYRLHTRALVCFEENHDEHDTTAGVWQYLGQAQEFLTVQLLYLILPLYNLGWVRNTTPGPEHARLFAGLWQIVVSATTLARQLRIIDGSLFEWTNVWKGTKFDPERMEAINIGTMLETSPYIKDRENDRTMLKEGVSMEHSQPLVRAVLFPGSIGYWREGFLVKELENQGVGTLDYKSRLCAQAITKSIVLLHWGKESLSAELAGTSAWRDAVKNGDKSEFNKDREGVVELADLFMQYHDQNDFDQVEDSSDDDDGEDDEYYR